MLITLHLLTYQCYESYGLRLGARQFGDIIAFDLNKCDELKNEYEVTTGSELN